MSKKPHFILFVLVPIVLAIPLLASCGSINASTTPTTPTSTPHNDCTTNQSTITTNSPTANPCKILVFSKTGAFRHASIKDGKIAIQKLVAQHHIIADFTEDATMFT